ncbi:MAG TPA: NAD(P)/FAD-dependent oxidoreductase, partial [Candidatus Omnitrophota bacterium]|nr:NAD(P)/FAD-dependent oxidoreductase [Candidatus Omnitrophota bacterium]
YQVSPAEQKALLRLFKDFKMDIKGSRSFMEAMVTQGGVDLRDINPRTMESRLIRGLFFAGELIDIDGTTGGFNLQAAFSTGYMAGEKAAV